MPCANHCNSDTELLQEATELCASVGGTPVDNSAAISSLAPQPGAASLYSSFAKVDLASSKLAIASSESLRNSLEIVDGSSVASAIVATATSVANATLTATTANTGGMVKPAGTGTAPIAAFTGGAAGPIAEMGYFVWVVVVVVGEYLYIA